MATSVAMPRALSEKPISWSALAYIYKQQGKEEEEAYCLEQACNIKQAVQNIIDEQNSWVLWLHTSDVLELLEEIEIYERAVEQSGTTVTLSKS